MGLVILHSNWWLMIAMNIYLAVMYKWLYRDMPLWIFCTYSIASLLLWFGKCKCLVFVWYVWYGHGYFKFCCDHHFIIYQPLTCVHLRGRDKAKETEIPLIPSPFLCRCCVAPVNLGTACWDSTLIWKYISLIFLPGYCDILRVRAGDQGHCDLDQNTKGSCSLWSPPVHTRRCIWVPMHVMTM